MTILDELERTLLDEKRSIDMDEARGLVDLPAAELPRLLGLAHEVRRRWWGEGVELESLISAQTGGCQEDCAFCSQSMHYDAPGAAPRVPAARPGAGGGAGHRGVGRQRLLHRRGRARARTGA